MWDDSNNILSHDFFSKCIASEYYINQLIIIVNTCIV